MYFMCTFACMCVCKYTGVFITTTELRIAQVCVSLLVIYICRFQKVERSLPRSQSIHLCVCLCMCASGRICVYMYVYVCI